MRPMHLRWNDSSPTASTSSSSSTSGLTCDDDREREAHLHAARVGAHRHVDELLELRERHDRVEPLVDVALAEAVDGAVHVDVLAPGEVGVEAGAQLQHRGDGAADLHRARVRRDDPRQQLQEGALARPVVAHDRHRLARADVEVDVVDRPEVLRGGAAAAQHGLLERGVALVDQPEAARHPAQADLARAPGPSELNRHLALEAAEDVPADQQHDGGDGRVDDVPGAGQTPQKRASWSADEGRDRVAAVQEVDHPLLSSPRLAT